MKKNSLTRIKNKSRFGNYITYKTLFNLKNTVHFSVVYTIEPVDI